MAETEMQEAARLAKERYEHKDEYSPMMQHYISTKVKYADCILLYRLGDFFEMFFEDAKMVARDLELTLTGKDCGQDKRAPMCGIPHHAVDSYISRLVQKGYKVAICEQLEDPSKAKGIVKRDVIKIVTPGTQVDGSSIEDKRNNFIMSIYKEGTFFGVAVCDISTGDFYATEIREDNNFSKLIDEISRFNPSEIIVNKMMGESQEEIKEIRARFDCYITFEKDIKDDEENPSEAENLELESGENLSHKKDKVANVSKDAYAVISKNKSHWGNDIYIFSNDPKYIKEQFEITSESGENIDITKKMFAVCAINGLMNYIEETQKQIPENLNKITFYEVTKYMTLDINARRNLEITERMRDKSKRGTLLWVLDKTSTAMRRKTFKKMGK